MSKQLVELKARLKVAAIEVYGTDTEHLRIFSSWAFDDTRVTNRLKRRVVDFEDMAIDMRAQREGLANGTLVKRTAKVFQTALDSEGPSFTKEYIINAGDDSDPTGDGYYFCGWVN